MKRIAFFTVILLSLYSCDKEIVLRNIITESNRNVASVLKLSSDTTLVYLTDYFPILSNVDSITSKTLKIEKIETKFDKFSVIKRDNTTQINIIDVWKNSDKVSIVANLISSDLANVPLIASNSFKDEEVQFVANGEPDQIVAMWQNVQLPGEFVKITKAGFIVKIPENSDNYDRSYIRVYASNKSGVSNDVIVPLDEDKPISRHSQLSRQDKHTFIMYSLMIDRFYNGNTANDFKINSPDVNPKVDYMGGDLAGVTQKIKDGFFNDLGVNTIWLSPIMQNPYDAWGEQKDPYTKFSGYHGYWPIFITKIDKRFGDAEQLKELLDEAHKHGLNVLLDYVANHMHINSPTLKEHPKWVTELLLPDGRKNLELWDEYRLTTWFDEHIPTLDLEQDSVNGPLTDSAVLWVDQFDIDGFRHDATKHVPESYWRKLTQKLKSRFPERQLYQVGETYGNAPLIDSYVKSGMLDGQFDFNVYDAATWAIGMDDGNFSQLANVLLESLRTYGYHNEMSYITGNHDRPRFISLAGGAVRFDEDSKAAGWKRVIEVGDTVGYDRLALLEAFIFTIPGIPCVYQGDEYGVPGGNDPDNRRMMQFSNYKTAENNLLAKVKKLISLRKTSLPMIYGDLVPLYVNNDLFVYARIYMGNVDVVALNRSSMAKTITVSLPLDKIRIANLKPQFGNSVRIANKEISFALPPVSFEILTNK